MCRDALQHVHRAEVSGSGDAQTLSLADDRAGQMIRLADIAAAHLPRQRTLHFRRLPAERAAMDAISGV